MKVSKDRKDFNMADALCEKTKIFMTTVNDCGKTDQCEFLTSNSIHLDISIQTETDELNGIHVDDQLQQLQANYKLSKNTTNSVTGKQNLPYVLLTPCDYNATNSSVLPIKKEEELSLNLDTNMHTPKQDLSYLILRSCSPTSESELNTLTEENEFQFKLSPAMEELSLSNSSMDIQTPKDLSNLIQKEPTCSSYDSKPLVSPVKENCLSLSGKSRNLKKTLQIQIEKLPEELVDKLLIKYNESLEHNKLQCIDELPNETASNLKNHKDDYKLKQLQIKPSYVILKRLSITDTDNMCQNESKSEDETNNSNDEIKLQETSHGSRNENTTEGESNERLTSTDISSYQMQQTPEKSSSNSSNQDSDNVTNLTDNGSILFDKDSDNVIKECQSQVQEKPDCSLQLPLPSELSNTLADTNNFQQGKQNRRIKRNCDDIPLSILLHDKVISKRIHNKTTKLPKTNLTYTNYKVNKQRNINNEPRKHKYQSKDIQTNKVNKRNLQIRRDVKQTLRRRSADQCKIKSKSPAADLATTQNQTVNKKTIAFNKSKDRRKPYTRKKIIQNKQESGMQLPKEQCKTEKSYLISRKRKSPQIDLEGKTNQNNCISSNNKENNRRAVKTKKLPRQNHHLDPQISTDHGSITELQEDTYFNHVPIQSNSLEKTLSENNIKQKNLNIELKKNTQPVRPAMQCNIQMVTVRNIKPAFREVYDSFIMMDHHYERKPQKPRRNLKECKQLHDRRKHAFQPQRLATLALQTFFERRVYK